MSDTQDPMTLTEADLTIEEQEQPPVEKPKVTEKPTPPTGPKVVPARPPEEEKPRKKKRKRRPGDRPEKDEDEAEGIDWKSVAIAGGCCILVGGAAWVGRGLWDKAHPPKT